MEPEEEPGVAAVREVCEEVSAFTLHRSPASVRLFSSPFLLLEVERDIGSLVMCPSHVGENLSPE